MNNVDFEFDFKKKRIVWITGNSGQLGTHLTEKFSALPICTKIINTVPVDNLKKTGIKFYNRMQNTTIFDMYTKNDKYKEEIDIRDYKTVYTIIKEMLWLKKYLNYDTCEIYHCAAYTGTDKCKASFEGAYETNVNGTSNLIKAMKQLNFTSIENNGIFINFSTTAIFTPLHRKFAHEKFTKLCQTSYRDAFFNIKTPRNPETWYGKTKYMAESLVKIAFAGDENVYNVLPVFGAGRYPEDNASDYRKFATLVLSYLLYNENGIKKPQKFICKQHLDNAKSYFDVRILVASIIAWIDTGNLANRHLLDFTKSSINEGIFCSTKWQTLRKYFEDICEASLKTFYRSNEYNKYDAQHLLKEILESPYFENRSIEDYLASHIPEDVIFFTLNGIEHDPQNSESIPMFKQIFELEKHYSMYNLAEWVVQSHEDFIKEGDFLLYKEGDE